MPVMLQLNTKTLRYHKTSLYARMKLFFKYVSHYCAKVKWKHIFSHLGETHAATQIQNGTTVVYAVNIPKPPKIIWFW